MTMLKISFSMLLCVLFMSSSLSARRNQYHPALGKGVNFSETRSYATCVMGIETQSETTNPALTRLYNERRVQNRDDLHRAMDISASVSAKGMWGSASGSGAYFSNVQVSSEAFYWLVDAKYERSLTMINTAAPGFDLTPRAKEILRRFGLQAFYEACGTHFYAGKRVGARYSLLYEFESQGDKSLTNIAASASYGGFGVKAKADFKSFIESSSSRSQLTIHSFIVGGDDRIKDYAKNPEDLESELSRLKEQLYREEKGVVLKWYIDAYDQFPEVIEAKRSAESRGYVDIFRNNALSHYYTLYMHNLEEIRTFETKLLRASGEEPYYYFSPEKTVSIREMISAFHRQNALIQERAIDCISKDVQRVCQTDDIALLQSPVISPDKDFSGFSSWEMEPRFSQDWDDDFLSFNLAGTLEGTYKEHVFWSDNRLLSGPGNSAYFRGPAPDGIVNQLRIGSVSPVVDPKTGRYRPALCMGNDERVCNIRVIENPNVNFGDGAPLSRVQLTLFDAKGYIFSKYDFWAKR